MLERIVLSTYVKSQVMTGDFLLRLLDMKSDFIQLLTSTNVPIQMSHSRYVSIRDTLNVSEVRYRIGMPQ